MIVKGKDGVRATGREAAETTPARRTTGERSRTSAARRTAPEALRSLLVPVDLTPAADRVVGRVARLPLARDARVTLLHVVPDGLPVRDRRRAARDAAKVLADAARDLRSALPVRVEPLVGVGAPAAQIAACAQAKGAELIVMGRGQGRRLRDVLLGSTAERVIRHGRLPVLVVRRPPRDSYRRPAVALDLDRAAHHVIRAMLRVVPPPRPAVTVIHAFDDPYRRAVYPSLFEDLEAREAELRLSASRALGELLADAVARARVPADAVPAWKLHVRYGSPQTVIEKAVEREATDLLVLGTHTQTGLAHMLLGTVAGDVLRAVACDVLVVPPRAPRR